MSSSSSPAQSTPAPCAKGCGFYGSAEMHNLCSKCFRESGLSKVSSSSSSSPSSSPEASTPSSPKAGQPTRPVQKNPSRCFVPSCRKKIGLAPIKCYCGYTFCSTHRVAEAHNCDYDFRSANQERLKKENPVVAAKKLDKI